MIDISEVSSQLDLFYGERINKINNLKTILQESTEKYEELCCDTLVVMLYAQLEGYVTDILIYYIEVINAINLKMKDVKFVLCAASKSNIFESYEERFKNKDKYKGRINFIQNVKDFWEEEINIPHNLVDTKSNLKETVFCDLMLKLGFEKSLYCKHGSLIDEFVDQRNAVAHGDERKRITTIADYKKYENLVINIIMKELKDNIFDAINNQEYLILEG